MSCRSSAGCVTGRCWPAACECARTFRQHLSCKRCTSRYSASCTIITPSSRPTEMPSRNRTTVSLRIVSSIPTSIVTRRSVSVPQRHLPDTASLRIEPWKTARYCFSAPSRRKVDANAAVRVPLIAQNMGSRWMTHVQKRRTTKHSEGS